MQLERFAAVFAVACLTVTAMPASAATLDRIRESGSIKLGYLADARPFSFRNEAGAADGYAVALCQQVADQVKSGLALPSLRIEWVAVTPDDRLSDVQQGNVDLLCAPTSATLARRQDVSFSIPIFAGGNRAVVRADAPTALREALGESKSTTGRLARCTRGQGAEGNDLCRRRRDDVGEMAEGPADGVAGGRPHRPGRRLSVRIAAAA